MLQTEKPPANQPKELASGNSRSCRHLRRLLLFIDMSGTMVAYREMKRTKSPRKPTIGLLLVNIMPRLLSPCFSPATCFPRQVVLFIRQRMPVPLLFAQLVFCRSVPVPGSAARTNTLLRPCPRRSSSRFVRSRPSVTNWTWLQQNL